MKRKDTLKVSRREFMKQAAAMCVGAFFYNSSSGIQISNFSDSGKKPLNVLFLFSDEHNPYFSSPYGHPFVQTPNMAKIAERGVVFEAGYCPSPLCGPSRAAFFTGLHCHQVPSYSNGSIFDGSLPTWSELLTKQGIHTVHVGKTDVWPDVKLPYSEILLRRDRKRPGDINFRRRPLAVREGEIKRMDGYGVRLDPFAGDNRIFELAEDWLRKRANRIGKPWVLTVHFVCPHFPHYVTQDLWDMYADHADDLPKYDGSRSWEKHPYKLDLIKHFDLENVTEKQIRNMRRGYFGKVTYIDRMIGRVLSALEESGQADNTIVIYTSDHGEMLGEHGLWWKCSMDEHSVRVPLIMSGPGIPAGIRVKTPVSTLDAQATFFEATGSRKPDHWVGNSLREILNDPSLVNSRVVFSEYHGHGVRSGAFMVRKGAWKMVYNMAAPNELYNLIEDPDETKNLAESNAEKFSELEAELRRICDPEEENELTFMRQGARLKELGLM
ncbi:sulfatase-like hydrolase/transferase, partial [candidate division KSB1 bacterium]